MSELSCDTPFIGQNETHDLSRYYLRREPCKNETFWHYSDP